MNDYHRLFGVDPLHPTQIHPGRVWFDVDLSPHQMKEMLPLIDFNQEFPVVYGYGSDVEIVDLTCPQCAANLKLDGAIIAVEGMEWSNVCAECGQVVDDSMYYTGLEEFDEAVWSILCVGDYPKYQVWQHDSVRNAAMFRDAPNYDIFLPHVMDQIIQSYERQA